VSFSSLQPPGACGQFMVNTA